MGKIFLLENVFPTKVQHINTYKIVAFFTNFCRFLQLNEVSFGFLANVRIP